MESFGKKFELPPVNQLEIPLEAEREEDFEKLEGWLTPMLGTEEAEQCVFVLKTMSDTDFVNQCDKAVKEFGKRLNEQFGEEESFFELVPSAKFSDIRSEQRLDKIGYKGKHHDVGLLEFSSKDKGDNSLIFDLNYGEVSRKGERRAISVFSFSGDNKRATEVLRNKYGGDWKVIFELDKKTGNFIFKD